MKAITDERLASRSQAGDKEAESELVGRYWEKAGIIAAEFPIQGVDYEDRHSLALEGLLRAVRRYEPGNGTTFKTFAKRLILNSLRDQNRVVYSKFRRSNLAPLSLDAPLGVAETDGKDLVDTVESSVDVEAETITAVTAYDLVTRIFDAQREVMEGIATGATQEEVADQVGITATLVASIVLHFRRLAMFLAPDLAPAERRA